ncbi:MAG: efflux RND transporter permease subunit [Colwellia sp.]|nr:efflux RND transporter permease subunit [Colwellia sp.]
MSIQLPPLTACTEAIPNNIKPAQKYNSVVIVMTFLVTILGVFMAFKLPNALLPAIDRPEIVLQMSWSGKNAQELEQSLISPLEDSLQRVNHLIEQKSNIAGDSATMLLKFKSGTDMQQSYIDVLAAINQVSSWPSEVPRPTIINRSSGTNATLATAMLYANETATTDEIVQAFRRFVKPSLMMVEGVASITPFGNSPEQRIDIEFDSKKLAEYSLPIKKILSMLNNLSDSSGDKLILGSREYGLNFKGKMTAIELAALPIHNVGNNIIRLGDIAQLHKRLITPWGYAAINGKRAFYFRLKPTKGVNALQAVDAIKTMFSQLNQGELKQLDMTLVLSRDDSKDIKNAIEQVYLALLLGIVLSGVILFCFIRNINIVTLIFISVPVCLSMVMLAMSFSGFSLNVISLAGIALSVGLLLDAAIVVVESILTFKKQGHSLSEAIALGRKEVSSAIFSSTLSSIVIFIPILMINSTESQLFEDLAFTISSALLASLLVALVIIPAFARYLISDQQVANSAKNGKLVQYICASARSRTVAIGCLVLGGPIAIWLTVLAMPDIDVLPDPKQRVMISIVSFNQPISEEAVDRVVAQPILQRIEQQKSNIAAPDYDVSGIVCGSDYCYLYFNPAEGWEYKAFKTWVETNITHDIPGTQVFSRQGSLLSFALPNSRTTQLDIQGANLEQLQLAGKQVLAKLKERFPEANIRATTPLDNQAANIEFTPKYEQLLYYGLTAKALNLQLSALTQGVYLGRSFYQGDSYPFYLKAQQASDIETLLATDIYIPNVGLTPLSELVSTKFSLAPDSLLRINKKATVSLALTPAANVSISSFSEQISQEVDEVLNQPEFQQLYAKYRGSADQLSAFIQSFLQMFVFSIILLIFLLWLSLNSWKLAIAVMLSMPLAFAGGMLFLQLLNLFVNQALDIITMIGFIILLGLVINNAILLASKYQSALQKNLSQYQAITLAIECRKRPIYMSTATSIFGMLPLMLLPGEGAEIYRGLAAVIIGGMTFSALFSLSYMAALLSMPIFSPNNKTASLMTEVEEEKTAMAIIN